MNFFYLCVNSFKRNPDVESFSNLAGRLFLAAKGRLNLIKIHILIFLKRNSFSCCLDQSRINKAASCIVTYKYLRSDLQIYKMPQYFPTCSYRLPKVVDMAATFIQNIILSPIFKISELRSVYFTGFCLGGHMSANVAVRLKEMFRGQMAGAVWGKFCSTSSFFVLYVYLFQIHQNDSY